MHEHTSQLRRRMSTTSLCRLDRRKSTGENVVGGGEEGGGVGEVEGGDLLLEEEGTGLDGRLLPHENYYNRGKII